MSWQEIFKERTCTAKEAVQLIKSNDRVCFAHAVAEPPAIVDAMVANAAAYKNVEICHMISTGSGAYSAKELSENFTHNSWFTSANTRNSLQEGHGQFTPVFFHEVPAYMRNGLFALDVFMLQITPPDKTGYVSLGLSSDYTMQGIESAKIVLAQVNDQLPYTCGDCIVHVSKFDRFVIESTPIVQVPSAPINDVANQIGELCVDLIEDGSTLQVGIGAIPEAITRALTKKKDLGVHSELVTDELMKLFLDGVITNDKKSLNKGKLVATFLMGTQDLYDFADLNPVLELHRVDYVNHPMVVAKCAKMVSVNSALEVDFMGQVVSDSIGTRQFSGVGGQVDFVRGVSMSLDGLGKSIIALPSTAKLKDGTVVSKITPYITHGAAVTTSRNDVDIIATEYGIAKLKGRSLQDRARLLIGIAHPDFRDELIEEFSMRFNVAY
jgi:4-hydroxybutyrate CoA-transferase